MAKKSQLARDAKREKLVKQHLEKRRELRKKQANEKLSPEERNEASIALNKMPRDSSPSRITTRCKATGVSRAVYRKFKLNRISFRKMALNGELPGVTKSSW